VTWTLIKQSLAVLREDKKLLLFPILSAIGAIAVTVPYFWAFTGAAPWRQSELHWAGPIGWLWLFLWYCSSSFVMIFFNCALAFCAQTRFSGAEPTIADGLRQAGNRAGSILLWAAVSSTAGILVRMIEERVGWVGQIAAGLFGIGWSLATYLMVPVLVLENRGVIESIRRSSELLKKTWGEQLVVGLHFLWMMLVVAIPGIILGVLAWPVGILYFAAMAAAMTAARQIFVVALYRYAATGQPPNGYSSDALGDAFRRR
jgi:Family of unknown function (DUF6159)